MAIQSVIPNDYLVPGTAHRFNYLRQAGALVDVPLRIAIIGTKSASGTAVVGKVYDATDAATTDALGGASSEAAIMCRQAYICAQVFQRGPQVKVTFLAEPGAGTANVQTLTLSSNASADGNFILSVAGRQYVIGVANGALPSAVAANIAATLQARAEQLPVTVSVAGAVVTFTHPTKGVNGKDVKIAVVQGVSGVTSVIANPTVGAGVSDIQPAIDALAPLRYDGIVSANHTTADIAEILLDLAQRWAVSSKTWGWWFLFEPGTIGTATTLAAASNHRAVIIGSYEGCLSAPGEGAVTMAMLVFSRERPNSGYDGVVVPLYPPDAGTLYTPTEQNTAIHAGLTAFTGILDSTGSVIGDRSQVVELVTSATTVGGLPDDRNRDIAVSRTGVYLALQLDAAVAATLGPQSNPDGVNQGQALELLGDINAAILRAESRQTPPVVDPDFVEADIASFQAARDTNVPGKNNANIFYHPALPNHQTGWNHNILV